jgi:hypothetical protein
MSQLILKCAPVGDNQDDFDVLEDGVVVGRIFFLDAVGPQGPPWMWPAATTATSNARHTAMSRHARRRWRCSQRGPRRE